MTITLSPREAARGLLLVVVTLAFLSVAGQFSRHVLGHDVLLGFVRQFNLDAEGNVPAWYASMTLLLSAVLLGVIARAKHLARAPYARHWGLLVLIFVGLSVDEAASLHEMAVHPLRALLRARGVLYFAWVVPGAVFVLAVGLAYLRFLLHLPPAARRGFIVAGGLFVGGALGMELAGGYVAHYHGEGTPLYTAMTTVEECLEMLGIVVFIHALLSYLRMEVGEVRIRFGD